MILPVVETTILRNRYGTVVVHSDWIPKHFQKDRLGEAVEQFDGALALAAQRIRLVQDRRDPPLLVERGKRNLDVVDDIL